MTIVVFDLETTGFSPRYHEIIQIAARRIVQGKVTAERFATFVQPREDIPPHITELTGISMEHVADAPDATSALLAFSRFAGDATLVAHNGRRFDMNFIRESCLRERLETRAVPFIDSMDLSRQLWGAGVKHAQDDVIGRLGILSAGVRRHDARDDVQLLTEAVRIIWERLGAALDKCPVTVSEGLLPRQPATNQITECHE